MSIISNVQNLATRNLGRGGLLLQKWSPEILTGVGVVGVVAGAVIAAKATLKLEPIVEDAKADLQAADELYADNQSALGREKTKALVKASGRVLKLYSPALAVGGTGLISIISATGIARKRLVAVGAAYSILEDQFDKYRDRVKEELGEERESDIRRSVRTEKQKVDGKNVEVKALDVNGLSIYARCFDEGNKHFKAIPEYNLLFLTTQQNFLNDMLHARGHVLLNDVYDALGFERTKAGAVVGWVISKTGDNFIDFGLYGAGQKANDFINGLEEAIWLDFNVDGVVYDKI